MPLTSAAVAQRDQDDREQDEHEPECERDESSAGHGSDSTRGGIGSFVGLPTGAYNPRVPSTDTDQTLEEIELNLAGICVHAVARAGPRPIVFVHGLAGSSTYFLEAAARAEISGRGLLALDLPGFGRTLAPDGFGFTMREQASILVAAVEAVEGDITLVGHSMGGTIALLASAEIRDRLAALVIAEGVISYDATLWSEQIARISTSEWARAFADLQRRPEIFVRGGMVRRRRDAVARVAPAVLQTSALAMRASAADLHEVSVDPALYDRFLSMSPDPVYVFGDYHDNTSMYARLRSDGARVELVHRAGHLMMLDNPDGFYRIVANA